MLQILKSNMVTLSNCYIRQGNSFKYNSNLLAVICKCLEKLQGKLVKLNAKQKEIEKLINNK